MNISVIDYIGKVRDGIAILLSWVIDDETYEIIYWFNKNDNYRLYVDDRLLERLKIKSIYDFNQLSNLLIYINSVIPPKENIFKEFYDK